MTSPEHAPRDLVFTGSGGLRLAGDTTGDGDPPVILLHGGGQTRLSWRGTAVTLAAAGFRAVTYDARGHGDSEWSVSGDYRLPSFADDLEQVIDQLGGRAVVVGASLGGLSAALLAGELAPERICGVVLVDIIPDMDTAGASRIQSFMVSRSKEGFASLDEAADAIAEYNPARRRPRDTSGLHKNMRERNGRWYWHWDPRFIGGFDDVPLNRVSDPVRLDRAVANLVARGTPAMLVRGRMSDLVSEDSAREFVRRYPAVEFVDVSGAGHMIVGDRNEAFTDATASFLRRHHPTATATRSPTNT